MKNEREIRKKLEHIKTMIDNNVYKKEPSIDLRIFEAYTDMLEWVLK